MQPTKHHQCAQCKQQTNLKRCTACHSEYYCSKECQKKHWTKHKSFCQTIQRRQLFFQTCMNADTTNLETLLQQIENLKFVNEFCDSLVENVLITPLAICFLNWDWKSMQLLLQHKADPIQTCYKQKQQNEPLHLSLLGLIATKVKLLQIFPLEECLQFLVEHCGCDINALEMDFCTVFQLAAFHGNLRFIKACLEQDPIASKISINSTNPDGFSALHLSVCQSPDAEATTEQFLNLFDYLVSKGASVDQPTKNGASLLMLAMQHNRTHFEELLRNKYGMELDLKQQMNNFLDSHPLIQKEEGEEEIEMKDEDIMEKLEVREWKQDAPSLQLKMLQMKLVFSSPNDYETRTIEKQIQQFQKKAIEFKIHILRNTRHVRDDYLKEISSHCIGSGLLQHTITQRQLFNQIEQVTKQVLYKQLIQNEQGKDEEMILAIKFYEWILKYVSFQVAIHPTSLEEAKFDWENQLQISSSLHIDIKAKQLWKQSRELENTFSTLQESTPLPSEHIYFEVLTKEWNKEIIKDLQQTNLFWIVSNSNGMFSNERRLIRILLTSMPE